MSFAKEFREFAVKGNVVDMAVGIVVAVAEGGESGEGHAAAGPCGARGRHFSGTGGPDEIHAMPKAKPGQDFQPLAEDQVELVKKWIDQGAK